MTLANAKSTLSKSTFTKSLLVAAGAAALLFALPAKSDAQVAFRVQFGGPVVAVAPAYDYGYGYGYGYYDQRRAWTEHEERERWLREHRYDRDDFYDRDLYRDHDDYDRDRRDRDDRGHDRDDRR